MDDRRFDSLVKALATGTSRRSVVKGLLGLGGATLVGTSMSSRDVDAARRPTPTPKPLTCPGQQIAQNGQCVCPAAAPSKCGPDCCNPAGVDSAHSECCDNACCFGHCYGEELCCEHPLVFCEAQNQCCFADDNQCCGSNGCCDTACCPVANGTGACCEGATPKCCPGNACIPESGCCSDDECPGCQTCQNNICADDNAECVGCLDCVQGTCQTVDANCDDGDPCTASTCTGDGSCTPTVRDCRLAGCGCVVNDVCRSATCNQSTGACDEAFDCSGPGCCTPPNMCFQSVCDVNVCRETLFCANDELTEQESDSCCEEFGNPDPACLYVSGAACTTVCPSGLGFVQVDNGCCFKVFCDCCTAYDEAGIVDFADCLGSCVFSSDV